jgi:hypothetical protein
LGFLKQSTFGPAGSRLTFPTGRFDPAWLRAAAAQHARLATGVPAGQHLKLDLANPSSA